MRNQVGLLYTVGLTESYEKLFEEHDAPMKMGKRPDYPGGSVWSTREEAKEHCPEGYSVYGVRATEVEDNPEKPWDNLIHDSPLVKNP